MDRCNKNLSIYIKRKRNRYGKRIWTGVRTLARHFAPPFPPLSVESFCGNALCAHVLLVSPAYAFPRRSSPSTSCSG